MHWEANLSINYENDVTNFSATWLLCLAYFQPYINLVNYLFHYRWYIYIYASICNLHNIDIV